MDSVHGSTLARDDGMRVVVFDGPAQGDGSIAAGEGFTALARIDGVDMSATGVARKSRDPKRMLSTELLLNRLRRLATLSGDEIALLLSLGEPPRPHPPGTTICPHDDGSPHPRLMVSGWAGRPRILSDGRRQMLGILVPGDLMGDLTGGRGARRPLAMNPVVALTQVRTISVARLAAAVRDRPGNHPGIVRALAAIDCAEEGWLLDHVVRLGVQSARQRMGHLLLELHGRLATIGFVHNGAFPLPLTQDMLGELLGLSLVHVNRIVAQLRREKLALVRGGVVTILDFGRLALLADHADPMRDDAGARCGGWRGTGEQRADAGRGVD